MIIDWGKVHADEVYRKYMILLAFLRPEGRDRQDI
jgi:hypothetical protein